MDNGEKQFRDALDRARLFHGALRMAIDDGDDFGEHVGLQRYRRAVHTGQAEILRIWEEALEALPEPDPLPPRLYGNDATRVYLCPPAPLSMVDHGCMNCGQPFPAHTRDGLVCPDAVPTSTLPTLSAPASKHVSGSMSSGGETL